MLIKIDSIEIEITEERVDYMKKKIAMDNNIYIRNKKDAIKLSAKISKNYEEDQKKKLKEANKNDDMFYIANMLDNLSIFDIFKILVNKSKKYI